MRFRLLPNKLALTVGVLFVLAPSVALAITSAQRQVFNEGIYYFNTETSADSCAPLAASPSSSTAQPSNLDYAGRTILNQGELKALNDNAPTYQQAASQVGVPWQVLAALHYREHDFSLSEPGNGQGIYQIVNSDKHTAGDYPAAGTTLTTAQFLGQSLDAANYIKSDGAGLDISSDTAVIKDAFVKYNGEPSEYVDQAMALGFSSSQGYEGSPYVMNIADKPRDPSNGPISGWLQDRGGGDFQPATADQYGAYVVYASISGQTLTGSCASGNSSCTLNANASGDLSSIRQSVVCNAEAELAKWDSGQLTPGSGYLTYSQNTSQDWCGDFASWVYDQAGYPLSPDPHWRIPAVSTIKDVGQQDQKFHWHATGSYTPRPGDLAIHYNGSSYFHVNIVVGVSGDQVTLVGGNQTSNDFNQSNVSKVTSSISSSDIAGYVTPD